MAWLLLQLAAAATGSAGSGSTAPAAGSSLAGFHGSPPAPAPPPPLSAFQPYAAHQNTIHVATADFDGVGAKDYVVTVDAEGTVVAHARPATISDPAADNRLWTYSTNHFGFMLGTAKANRSASARDHVLLPGADGRLRMLDAKGRLRLAVAVGSGPTYSVDAGFTTDGSARLVAGGVDGWVYFFDWEGRALGRVQPAEGAAGKSGSIIRRVVVGNFDGAGGDEVAVFLNTGGFASGCHFTFLNLDTLRAPAYWSGMEAVLLLASDDVTPALGWTDKQLPQAVDIDLDGADELVAHWGILRPALGPRTLRLSTMAVPGEVLAREAQYDDVHPFTLTNKYIMQKGVVGKFRRGEFPSMVTVYGDDLYHVKYSKPKDKETEKPARFRVDDYTYAHTLFHFTDGAVLESRLKPWQPGGLDKLVLSGPNNGDDRFYVVDLAAGNGSAWRAAAKTIDKSGAGESALVGIRRTLDALASGVDAFAGTVAAGGVVSFIHPINNTATGWKLPPAEMEAQADAAAASYNESYAAIFGAGVRPKKVRLYCDLSLDADKNINTSCAVRWVSALAKRGVYMQILVQHGGRVFVEPEELMQIYHASVVGNHSYLMLATKELQAPSDLLLCAPLMEVLKTEAAKLGLPSSRLMVCPKGAVMTGMNRTQFETLKGYSKQVILGAENSNVRVNEWCFAERASLWLTGDFDMW
jgi:hypothetical protein